VNLVRSLTAVLLFAVCGIGLSFAQAASPNAPSGEVAVAAVAPPAYPRMAQLANVSGDISVVVTLRPDGVVESATVLSGIAFLVLREAALDSARQTRFECRGCTGTVSYLMLYTFRIVKGPDCCKALDLAPTIEQQSQAGAPRESWQTHVIVTVEQACICEGPAVRVTRTYEKVRSLKCLYLWKCSKRLVSTVTDQGTR